MLLEPKQAALMDGRRFYLFPQMTNWLPDDEAARLRLAFETELQRLRAA